MKTIHAIFPSDFNDKLIDFFKDDTNYKIVNFDQNINTFKDYVLNDVPVEIADISLMWILEDFNIPLEVQIKELIEKSVEIKLAHVNLRMVFLLPMSFRRDINLIKDLVSIGVYDIHFTDSYNFEELQDWLNNPMSLADMRNFIKANADDPRHFAELFDTKEKEVVYLSAEPRGKEIVETKSEKVILKTETVEKIVRLNTTIEQQNIAVIALSKGAGATFHSVNLATHLAANNINVGLYENPTTQDSRTYLADMYNLFNEHEEKKKQSLPHMIVNREPFNDTYVVDGVSIYATDYMAGLIDSFNGQQMMKYLNNGKHTVKIVDLGMVTLEQLQDNDYIDMLTLFHHVIVIVDIMPMSIIPNMSKLTKLQKQLLLINDLGVNYLVNRFDNDINKKEYKHLNLINAMQVQAFSTSSILKAMFKNKSAYAFDNGIKEQLAITYNRLLDDYGIDIEVTEPKLKNLLKLKIFAK